MSYGAASEEYTESNSTAFSAEVYEADVKVRVVAMSGRICWRAM
jgi:hypothetical protein